MKYASFPLELTRYTIEGEMKIATPPNTSHIATPCPLFIKLLNYQHSYNHPL